MGNQEWVHPKGMKYAVCLHYFISTVPTEVQVNSF